ncbi:efflux RND transporter periplasmic adaptor subunit [Tellurirhabdus rosea]|uniref:efflux RND transporter periplasmic adaptor subunit n=1 Tax=Tellurirhabdus rosea TaxID=2674997 RepID=UPI002252AAB2|nr:efflux RND transporter periplasmic adaptor subunit [Tellurirhabdus rosea]
MLIGGAVALLMSNKQKQAAQLEEARRPLATTVSVATVERQTVTEAASYLGKTEFWREIQMNATTQGTIRELHAALNATVREGQPVLKVDAELLELQLAQAEAGLRKARTDLTRYETLHRENNLPASDLENARLQVKTAETAVYTLKKQIRDAVVLAPIGGTVTEKPIERGMFIAPGAPLMTITDVSAVKVVIHVPEAELAQFRPGRAVKVEFDAYPGRPFSGAVHQIRLKGGETGRFPVEIRVDNSSANPLRVGMSANVTLPGATSVNGLSIPRAALVTTSQQPAVYVLNQNRITLRTIETGAGAGTNVFVRNGLKAGEQVVVSGTEALQNGQEVIIK